MKSKKCSVPTFWLMENLYLLLRMAFIRVEKKKSGHYLRIVESYRENNKIKHRILYSLGRVEDYKPEALKRMGMRLYALGGGDLKSLLGNSVRELGRYNYGFYQVYRKVFSYYGLDKFTTRVEKNHSLEFSFQDTLMLMLMERLNDPVSKLGNYKNQEDYLGIGPVELHHIYRSLDYLADYSDVIQKRIFYTGRDLFNLQLDVVFYDVTTFYFDSEKINEHSIRQMGFSKDGKIGKTQVVFGLLIDKNKNPICYHIYRGDTWEGYTFEDIVKVLKQTYQIDKVIIVADRGMLNDDNLKLTTGNGYEFIVGERLKNLPASIQKQLIDPGNYKKQWVYDRFGEQITINYFTLVYKDRVIIGTYSKKREKKDAYEREQRLKKAKKLMQNPSSIKKKAKRYYLKNTADETYEIDHEKIKRDELYDGYLAISTSLRNMSIENVLDQYRHLFQVEHSFRTFKSYLETRPMFHWTDKRIEGHIALCYIAYAMLNQVLQRLSTVGVQCSENELRKALSKMQLSLVEQNKRRFYLRSNITDKMDSIINKLGVRKLPHLFPKEQLTNYLE